ncbi:MAG: hypothetical protein LBC86_00800 [Oscillospiraceae bacterium]|jgi:hypothetical protein|nr:hypothetical protein [Oscillospiraceae bacterium]
MARTIPNKGYGGIYGEEAAGKSSADVRGQRAQNAANDFAGAEKSASKEAPKVADKTTSSSTDVAEKGGLGNTPKYSGAAASGAAAAAKKMTPMGRLASMFRSKSGDGNSKKPLFAVGGLTGLIAIIMFGTSSLLPIHLISNMTDQFNSFNSVADRRTTRLIRRVIGKENSEAFNTWQQRNKLSPKRMARLNRNLATEGFRFEPNAAGQARLQTNRLVNGDIDINPVTGQPRWTTIANADVEFAQLMVNNPELRTRFNRGARPMKGPIAGWHNKASAFWLKTKMMVRNVFKDYGGATEGNNNKTTAQNRIGVQEDKVAVRDMALASRADETFDLNDNPILDADGKNITTTVLGVSLNNLTRLTAKNNRRSPQKEGFRS